MENNIKSGQSEIAGADETLRTNAGDTAPLAEKIARNFQSDIRLVQTTQILLLQRENVIDDAAATAILRAIDTASYAEQGQSGSIWQDIATLEERVEHALPRDIAGAASLGRTRTETIATALRMQWRDSAATLADRSIDLRSVLLHLAQAHTVTVMGAFADRRAAAPTTLGHFLGGVMGSLESSWRRMLHSIDAVNRSPLGSGLMVAEVFTANREESAKMLGFLEPIENTIDASGQVEDIVELLDALAAQSSVIQRFVHELLVWIRTDPTSFFIDERWESVPEPAHPAHAVSSLLEHLNLAAKATSMDARVASDLLRDQPYGPVSVNWEYITPKVNGVLQQAESLLIDAAAAVHEALIVNRAYLANRAGRLYSTASDVAAFLMEDQQISPADAQKIAGLAIGQMRDARLEAAQITPDIIDSAAVLVIGQELKVEMETLGRYIAPRRYIERRDVLGSAKSEWTRSWLANVQQAIEKDRRLVQERRARWEQATAELAARLSESAETQEN